MNNIRHFVKALIDRLLKPFGCTVSRRIGTEPIADMKRLMAPHGVRFVIDGGAYKGTCSIDMVRAFPAAAVYAFEPHPDSYRLLTKAVTGYANVKPYNLALGAASGQLNFYTNASPLTNSLARVSSEGVRNFRDIVRPTGELVVDVVDLASFIAEEKIPCIDILKLDLQGFELEALKGLGQALSSAKLIFMEIQFIEIYQGTPLFANVEIFLRERGFVFYQFYELVRSPKNGRLLYGDAIFLNSEYFSL